MAARNKQKSGLFSADSSIECGLAGGVLFFCVACLTSESTQLAILGTLFCIFAGFVLSHLQRENQTQTRWDEVIQSLPVPFALAVEPRLYGEYVKIAKALTKIVEHSDLLFHDLCRVRVENMASELGTLAKGEVVFDATETWRTAYQRVLETLRVKSYYSVAWVRSSEYWNDAPGRQSMRLNYEMVERGFRIERCHILPDELWPFDERMPRTGILEWLVEQQGRGIIVSLIRESDLTNEPDLLCDFAVYGDRAIGIQEMDEQARTVRFILSFDQASIRQALDRWERLALYSKSFGDFMDQLQT
jgi:hypothetical protein